MSIVKNEIPILEMFPHTGDIHTGVSVHVETVALLERLRNAKTHITITLDMDDYYRMACH